MVQERGKPDDLSQSRVDDPRQGGDLIEFRLPFGESTGIDRSSCDGRRLQRLIRREDPHFRAIDERRVVRIHAETHRSTDEARRVLLGCIARRFERGQSLLIRDGQLLARKLARLEGLRQLQFRRQLFQDHAPLLLRQPE